MAERNIQPATSALKASVWKHFGFYEVEGKKDLDKSHTIWKLCQTILTKYSNSWQKYFGNTPNMRNCLKCFYPDEEEKTVSCSCFQPEDHRASDIKIFPPTQKRVKRMTNSIATFISKYFALKVPSSRTVRACIEK